MGLILQIETATACCSVALAKNGGLVACKQLNERNVHSGVINLFIDELIKSSDLKYGDIDAVAVSSGPGSYTGLRIGVSTAKGLCYALDKPLIAVETLEAMAFGIISQDIGAKENSLLLCPMIDARRMEVFTAIFNYKGEKLKNTSAEVIDKESFNDLLAVNKVLFFGDGADKCRDILEDNLNASFYPDFINSAAYLTTKADERFQHGQIEDVAYFEPYYLKNFIAEKKQESLYTFNPPVIPKKISG